MPALAFPLPPSLSLAFIHSFHCHVLVRSVSHHRVVVPFWSARIPPSCFPLLLASNATRNPYSACHKPLPSTRAAGAGSFRLIPSPLTWPPTSFPILHIVHCLHSLCHHISSFHTLPNLIHNLHHPQPHKPPRGHSSPTPVPARIFFASRRPRLLYYARANISPAPRLPHSPLFEPLAALRHSFSLFALFAILPYLLHITLAHRSFPLALQPFLSILYTASGALRACPLASSYCHFAASPGVPRVCILEYAECPRTVASTCGTCPLV